jgi:histidinol phosphatase-like enzyme (inositol monophosphatase family)
LHRLVGFGGDSKPKLKAVLIFVDQVDFCGNCGITSVLGDAVVTMTAGKSAGRAMEADLTLLDDMADAARAIALRYFRKDIGLTMKSDASPVTRADREIEDHLRRMLALHAPDDGVFGEEMPPTGLDRPRLWVIDPIDGTGAFATGSPLFGTLFGLLNEGVPSIGAIEASATGERWIGCAGGEAWLNERPCRTSGCTRLARASIGATAINAYAPEARAAFDRLAARAAITRLGGDCYSYGLVAAGHLDAVIETGLKPYDFVPIVPIIEAAGGVMTDWQGAPLTLHSEGHVVAAASTELHEEICALLRAP